MLTTRYGAQITLDVCGEEREAGGSSRQATGRRQPRPAKNTFTGQPVLKAATQTDGADGRSRHRY